MDDNHLKEHILIQLRDLHKKVDKHITDNTVEHSAIKEKVSQGQIDFAHHKGSIGTMAAGIAFFISAAITALLSWAGFHK